MKVTSYKDYNVVYIQAPDSKLEDPRNVYPKVVAGLEGLGLQVHSISSESPVEGSQGTGFIIDPNGHILTCAHIFGQEKKASLWVEGKRFEADVINQDEENDLALLKIAKSDITDLQYLRVLNNTIYKMGQDVYTIGFPLSDILGNKPRLNKGLISSTVGLKDDPKYIQISVEIQPGNSGSPLVNENGFVVGLIQSTLNPMNVLERTGGSLPQNVNFAIKTDVIKEFLKNCNNKFNMNSQSLKPLEFDQVSKSVVQIRAGIVTEEYLQQPKMICKVAYQSFWDIWFRFKFFHMEFYDLETGKLLFKAGQYGDNPFSTESVVIDQTFKQIKSRLSL